MEETQKTPSYPLEWRMVIVALVLAVTQTVLCAGQLLPVPLPVPWVFSLEDYPGAICLLEFFSCLLVLMLAWRPLKHGFDDVREKKYTLHALVSVLCAAGFLISVGITAMVVRGFGNGYYVIFDFTALLGAFWMLWLNLLAGKQAELPGAGMLLIADSAVSVLLLLAVLYLHLK